MSNFTQQPFGMSRIHSHYQMSNQPGQIMMGRTNQNCFGGGWPSTSQTSLPQGPIGEVTHGMN